MIKEEQLRKTAAELNDVMGLNPPISPVLDTESVIEVMRKIIRLGLINPSDVFTPETEELLQQIKDAPEDEPIDVTPAEEQPPLPSIEEQIGSAMKLRELKDVVNANIEFKDLRPHLDEYKNVEILRDTLYEIITKLRMEADSSTPTPEPEQEITEDPVMDATPGNEEPPEAPEELDIIFQEEEGIPKDAIYINPKFEAACPKLSEAEYASLEDLILRDKVIFQPILLWNNAIIDGHNRYSIAVKYNIPFTVEPMDFASEEEAIIWIKENALSQRNLSDYARYEMIKDLEADLKAIGKKHMVYKSMQKEISAHNTRELLAEKAGMSATQIAKAKVLEEQAPEEVKEQLRTGKKKIGTAFKELKEKGPDLYNEVDDLEKAIKELDKWIKKHTRNELVKDIFGEVRDIIGKLNNRIPF